MNCGQSNKLKILIADDNLFNLKAMRMQLEKIYNWEISEAYNGEIALNLVKDKLENS